MKTKTYKFKVNTRYLESSPLPKGLEIIGANIQKKSVWLWFEIDITSNNIIREFTVYTF